ncbi:hypothetical protein NKR19_g3754 [Coniochaeta hoffmannii]|uniref:F-box domain-containing protein n=1 Tax=Coniochaeta hoffmannii TaxID=91930 RepID=A0AA38S883_9PEZI|nr:hypothetical protein NKR19_g3754 [Coniochaeta hoffmannii]
MSPSLEELPLELLDEILEFLDLPSICQLRLTSRTTAARCASSHHFRAFFREKYVVLTEQALRAFADATQAGGLCAAVQEVTISSSAIDEWPRNVPAWEDRRLPSRQDAISLLSRAFEGLVRNGATGRLLSLSLDSAPALPDPRTRAGEVQRAYRFDFKIVHTADVRTFDVVFHALGASRLQVEALNICRGPGHLYLSVSCKELDVVDWHAPGLRRALAAVRSLSMCVRNIPLTAAGGQNNDRPVSRREALQRDVPAWEAEGDWTSLARLLDVLGSLEDLDLQYVCRHTTSRPTPPMRLEWTHERLLQDVARSDSLSNLSRCRLRGVYAREADLLGFVKCLAAVKELSLETIFLTTGTFASIFDYCSDAATSLTKLDFDLLHEMSSQYTLVLFLGPDRRQSMVELVPPELGDVSLERCGDDKTYPSPAPF